ncbi:hypothetical protein B0T24DRAFT_517524 [Lasiosphaeria ovina]|uniref:Pyrroloquinoline quinone-dependent pyranose dehydrogenase beta-propeller domain-containing protein n=1 Tax=Lasiosphaeria ovina TaxID=92902 RepID=A0AAE0NMT3_9PEZI|nr:hypothetical protein B0T24DRAFT_517524 [Lasiosphaeria ovina]
MAGVSSLLGVLLQPLLYSGTAFAQQISLSGAAPSDCPNVPSSNGAPVVATGFSAQLVATGLSGPRGLVLDSKGALLVVEQGKGIKRLTLSDNGGSCLTVAQTTTLVQNTDLTHSIEVSQDGKTLFASTSDEVFSWAYDVDTASVSNQRTIIKNMTNSDHISRTLLLSRKQPDLLLVSRGSGENIDKLAAHEPNGISQIRAFNLSALPPGAVYDYPSQGRSLGWGLRNSVGVAEHPVTGGVYSVENSADQLSRSQTDIHQDNPGEELNFHGYLNGTTEDGQGTNYGYPTCFALWKTDGFPDLASGMRVGSQFALDPKDDGACASDYTSPRLTFQAHTAPLDIKFNANGTLAYVTFHGSWNRDEPVGYKLSVVSFGDGSRGEPAEPADSTAAAVDVLTNADLAACPGACFRPVGLAVDDDTGRVFMTSDSTGEIYVVQRLPGAGGLAAGPSSGVSARLGLLWFDGGLLPLVGWTLVVSAVLGGGVMFAVPVSG